MTFYDIDEDGYIESDIMISVEMVGHNSAKYKKSFMNELCRVIIHGVLHLCGYTDSDTAGKRKMRQLENKYLKLYAGTR